MDERLPSELSGGQQQRVAVARALVLEPAVLLFDEPLSNLDARLRRQMREEIRELQQRLGLTVVYVTHDQAEAMAVSDRIIVMNRARDRAGRRAARALRAPARQLRRRLHGRREPRAGTPRASRCGDGRGRARAASRARAAPRRSRRTGGRRDPARGDRDRSAQRRTHCPATVRKASYLGGVVEYTLDTPVGMLFAISSDVEAPHAPGASVGVTLARHGVVVVPPAAKAPGTG